MTRLISYVSVGTGAPVLALHGLGGDHNQMLGLIGESAGRRVIAADLPGHGDTDLSDTEPVSYPAFAKLAAELLDNLRAAGDITGPIPVIGVSMGAGIALRLAATRPDLVRQLILIRPAYLIESLPPHQRIFPLIGHLLQTLGAHEGAKALQRTPEYKRLAEEAPAMAKSVLGQFQRPKAVERARVLIELPSSAPLDDKAAYRTIQAPAVVIGAPQDPVHPEQVARVLASWLRQATYELVPRKMVDPSEHDAAVRDLVRRSLQEPSPTEPSP